MAVGTVQSHDDQLMLRSFQVHHAPQTMSRVMVRGTVDGHAQTQYEGVIHVAKEARGSDASLESKHILLSPAARADARPTLEVLTDEVQCAHGSAVGPIDPDQLFYAMARGMDDQQGRNLLIEAFFADICGVLLY